jgi:hypothetical protein
MLNQLRYAAFAWFLFCSSTLVAQDLSQLSDEEKVQGVGQFQPKKPKVDEPKKPEPKREDDRTRRHRNSFTRPAPPAIGGLGAGAIGAGAWVYSQQQPWQESNTDPVVSDGWSQPSSEAIEFGEMNSDLFVDQAELQQPSVVHTEPLKLRFLDRYSISAKAEAVFLRDMSSLNVPITQGIQSSRLKWNNGTGIDATLSISPRTKSEFGFDVGLLNFQAADSAQVASSTILYTDPHIGLSPHPFSSYREMSLLSIDSNLLLPDNFYHTAIGFRVSQAEDLLENRVLPNGLTHRIDASSTSYLLQASVAPRWEFRFIHMETQFQIGAGLFYGESSTQLRNVVGGASPGVDDVLVDRWKGTVYFRSKLGGMIPIGNFGKLRAGVQLLAQDQFTHAAGQMRSIDFVTPSYQLQTNSNVFGGLYAGLELYR